MGGKTVMIGTTYVGSLGDTLTKYQMLVDQQADIAIAQHPEWGADKW